MSVANKSFINISSQSDFDWPKSAFFKSYSIQTLNWQLFSCLLKGELYSLFSKHLAWRRGPILCHLCIKLEYDHCEKVFRSAGNFLDIS